MDKPRVFLGLPWYGSLPDPVDSLRACLAASCGDLQVLPDGGELSLLGNSFNALWIQALGLRKRGVTWFAMLHADVIPEAGWLDILYAEAVRTDADIVSAVIALKDARGLTSTAIDDPANPWEPLRRLTMREVHQMPETFGAKEAGHMGKRLLVNTGCWIARLDRPWCDAKRPDGSLACFFTVQDRIVPKANGDYEAEVIPEDWNFSRAVQDHGGRVLATRKVRVEHVGKLRYSNAEPWGTWSKDEKRRQA